MDRIFLHGIHLDVHLGVSELERGDEQEISVDVELEVDTRRAGGSDQVDDTIDYSAVHALVKHVACGHPHALVEALAERVATSVLARFPADVVWVRVRKPEALRDRRVDYAGLEIRRARHENQ